MIRRLRERFPLGRVVTWAVIGVLFLGFNLAFLYGLVDLCRLPVPVATLVNAVVGVGVRFLANDRWVFHQRRPTWARFRAYCAAIAVGFGVWYLVVNGLTWLGLYYLYSAVAATACSVGFNLAANFLWVWGRRGAPAAPPDPRPGPP